MLNNIITSVAAMQSKQIQKKSKDFCVITQHKAIAPVSRLQRPRSTTETRDLDPLVTSQTPHTDTHHSIQYNFRGCIKHSMQTPGLSKDQDCCRRASNQGTLFGTSPCSLKISVKSQRDGFQSFKVPFMIHGLFV